MLTLRQKNSLLRRRPGVSRGLSKCSLLLWLIALERASVAASSASWGVRGLSLVLLPLWQTSVWWYQISILLQGLDMWHLECRQGWVGSIRWVSLPIHIIHMHGMGWICSVPIPILHTYTIHLETPATLEFPDATSVTRSVPSGQRQLQPALTHVLCCCSWTASWLWPLLYHSWPITLACELWMLSLCSSLLCPFLCLLQPTPQFLWVIPF